MLRILTVLVLLFQLFFGVSQEAVYSPEDHGIVETLRTYQFYIGNGGYSLWYDIDKMEPVQSEYALDAFLPLDSEADPGVSFSVYEIGYDTIIALPVQGGEPVLLDVPELTEVYSASEAFPVVTYALEQAGYACVAEDEALSAEDFSTAYALFSKDGMYAALYITELASGTFLMALTYPEETADTWGVWLEEMAASFAFLPGV